VARSDRASGTPGKWEPDEVWVLEPEDDEPEPPAPAASTAHGGEAGRAPHRHNVPRPVVDELAGAAGARRRERLAARIADATFAYERDRYQDARKILRPLADEVPGAPAVRELYGLVLYRMGQWAPAIRQLEAFRELSASYDQHPVLADCYRALRRYHEAEAVWEDLRQASPSGELVAEGRIVAAGCRADQGDLAGAIALLARADRRVSHPKERHLRQWYVLADLYERAGELPRARELFNRILAHDREAFDVRDRLRALR